MTTSPQPPPDAPDDAGVAAVDPAAQYRDLPEHIDSSQYVEMVDVDDVPDPDGGRDPNTDWMLRHA